MSDLGKFGPLDGLGKGLSQYGNQVGETAVPSSLPIITGVGRL